MSHNMSIYRRLNPKLLVQAELNLDLLHWTNTSNNISNSYYGHHQRHGKIFSQCN